MQLYLILYLISAEVILIVVAHPRVCIQNIHVLLLHLQISHFTDRVLFCQSVSRPIGFEYRYMYYQSIWNDKNYAS